MTRKCTTKHCRNIAAKRRTICYKCITAKYKEKNPVKYAYYVLRNNAKRRGVAFELTFDEFSEFCVKYDYLAGKGRKKESYSIDRRDNTIGYLKSNIRVMTLGENSRKGTKTLNAYYDYYERKIIASVSTSKPVNEEDFDWNILLKEAEERIAQGMHNHDSCDCCQHDDKSTNDHFENIDEDCPF